MILVLVLVILAAILGLLRGGSLDPLANTKFRWVPLLFVALVVQLGFDLWDPEWLSDTGDITVLVATQAAVALFLGLNWKLPGMALAAFGFALNVLVIGVNGAMPISDKAAEAAGLRGFDEFGIKHERLDDDTALPWLADVIPLPGTGKIISAGDIFLAAGIGWLVYRRTTAPEEGDGSREEPAIPGEASG